MNNIIKKKKKHYVNNVDFCQAMVEYKENKKIDPDTRIPGYIGICIDKICNKLSLRPNFIGYSFREEMVGDAIENCIMAVDGFDANKTKNPFAYFSQIAWNAMLRRIAKEKKQLYLKYKNIQNMSLTTESNGELHISNEEYSNEIISSFEKNLLPKPKIKSIVGVESFITEEIKSSVMEELEDFLHDTTDQEIVDALKAQLLNE
jgi:hypothetical protein